MLCSGASSRARVQFEAQLITMGLSPLQNQTQCSRRGRPGEDIAGVDRDDDRRKALLVDECIAFVGSANLTEAAFDRNFEAGVLSRDRALAGPLARHFRTLVEHGKVAPLP
jgi:hypothetical protein